jgi:uncharacterized membrane protein (UPF0182 family)
MAKNSDQYIDKIVQQIAKCDAVVKVLKTGRATELKLRAQNLQMLKTLQTTKTSTPATTSAPPSPKEKEYTASDTKTDQLDAQNDKLEKELTAGLQHLTSLVNKFEQYLQSDKTLSKEGVQAAKGCIAEVRNYISGGIKAAA